MYKRSWTAYPAGRLTRTCPMPTRPLPPTARTHEDQHASPCSTSLLLHLSHPPPLLPFLPLHSLSAPSQRSRGTKREAGEKERWTQFLLPVIFHCPQREELALSSPAPFPTNSFHHSTLTPPPPLSSLPGCYTEGEYLSLLHTRLSVT